jgi:hypothetical protein
MQIRAYLYLMASAILVPVILFAGFALRLIEGAEADLARARVARMAERVALVVNADHRATHAALGALAGSPSLARADLAAFNREVHTFAAAGPDAWGILLDDTGRLLFNTLAPRGSTLTADSASPSYLPGVLAAQHPFVTDLIPGYVSGRLMT